MTVNDLYNITESPICLVSASTKNRVLFRFAPDVHENYKDLEVKEIKASYDSVENEDGSMVVQVYILIAFVDCDFPEPEIDDYLMFLKICAEAECSPEQISQLLGEVNEDNADL